MWNRGLGPVDRIGFRKQSLSIEKKVSKETKMSSTIKKGSSRRGKGLLRVELPLPNGLKEVKC